MGWPILKLVKTGFTAREAFRTWRTKRRALKGNTELTIMNPKKYKKLIGTVVGGLIGILITAFPIVDAFISVLGLDPSVLADQVALWLAAAIGTYFAPKNAT